MTQALRPLRFDLAKVFANANYGDAVDYAGVPERYVQCLRDYLLHGILPPPALRAVLEGKLDAVLCFRRDLPGLLAIVEWLRGSVAGVCWGSPDQVQYWCAFARQRACGTALREAGE